MLIKHKVHHLFLFRAEFKPPNDDKVERHEIGRIGFAASYEFLLIGVIDRSS